jgi:DNA-binding NarL/FixJ family response regulator
MATLSNLTPREREILQLVLAGRTNKAIANEFRIAEKTVEFHLNNMYAKIGVQTRLMAGLWAMQQGIEVETREFPS